MISKRISQETFDEVVKENLDDFEMEPAEALSEAIKQFKSQGVDLKNIDTSGGIGLAEMKKALQSLKIFAKNNEVFDAKCNSTNLQFTVEQQIKVLEELGNMCEAKCEQHVRNRLMMNPDGMNNLLELLVPEQVCDVLSSSIKLLSALTKNDLELRDFFEPGGSARVSRIIEYRLKSLEESEDPRSSQADEDRIILRYALALARSVSKSENNKNMLSRTGCMDYIATILTKYAPSAATPDGSVWTGLVSDACVVLRSLCVHDDMRREMSCAMDNGKFFLSTNGLVPALMAVCASFRTIPGVAGQALAAAKTLITTEDAVKTMALHGAMSLPSEILSYSAADTSLVRNCLGLARNLCADDMRKDKLIDDGSMRLAVVVMSKEEFFVDGTLMEHGAACLAAMSLRSPDSVIIIFSGLISL